MTSVDVVVPVYNEERALPESVPKLRDFLASDAFPYEWRIVIADNASVDGTPEAGRELEKRFGAEVSYVRIEQKGRGRALKQTWGTSTRDIVSYMDVDLSTGLDAFPPLIAAIAEDGYDIANGSRLLPGANVTRSSQRRILTRGYLLLIKAMFRVRFSDAQCGFKAMRADLARRLIPHIENNNWFFDTESLILAEKAGYRIKDIPVSWVEDLDTRVNVPRTVSEDVQGLLRLWRKRPWRALLADRGSESGRP
jgi:glycosyltransferase involved in cell wall biosynthesis